MRRWHLMAGLVVVASGLLAPLSGASSVTAAAKFPSCHGTQMKVNLGYTRDVRTNKTEEWFGWVRYTNEGSTCEMSKTDVGIEAVTRTTHVLLGQSSIADAVGRMPFYLNHGESASATVGLLVTYPKFALSCAAEAINTIEVTGYGYGWSNHFYSLAQWREPALCAGDGLAAFGAPLSPA